MLLIIDSEKTPNNKIKQSFIELGFSSIEIAKTAQQAREILALNEASNGEDKITLIIIAANIDDADEFELCREIKKIEYAKNIYTILLVSSMNNKTAIEKAKYSGASDFAIKPYSSPEFQQKFSIFLKTKTIILVEDDPVIRQMVRGILSKYSVEIIEIDDGLQARNLFNTILPVCIVLMDIGLPNMNGTKLVTHIRNKPNWKKTPVLMLTASSDIADVKKCLGAGANDYITKPFNISDFVNRLARYLADVD